MTDQQMYYILLDEVQHVNEFEDVLNSYLKIENADVPPHGTKYSMPWNKVFHPMEQNVPLHGTNRKVPPL